MQRIIMTAAAVMLLGAGLAITTAKAEQNYGPVTDQAKHLCFKPTPGNDQGFGYWSDCPKPAAATTVHHPHPKQS